MSIEKTKYNGWENCYRLANDSIELIVTTDVGPRIVRWGFIGGDNLMTEVPDDKGQTGGTKFRFYGGHRLWHAPEDPVRTYYPDNQPVPFELLENGIHLTQAVEPTTGIQKELEIRLAPDKARVEIIHRLRNAGMWNVRLAVWALTACAAGGTAILPMPPRGLHTEQLLPTNTLTLWAYTDMSDPRWTWGKKYILLKQDETRPAPQKLGALLPDGWLAYAFKDTLFIKKIPYVANATYPDFGCSAETFTNDEMLELESVGPYTELAPGEVATHREEWRLEMIEGAVTSEADVEAKVLPHVKSA